MVTPTTTTNADFSDSGASHHMTSDLGNLAAHNPYAGSDDVLLGDGSTLPITHSGSFSVPYVFLLLIRI